MNECIEHQMAILKGLDWFLWHIIHIRICKFFKFLYMISSHAPLSVCVCLSKCICNEMAWIVIAYFIQRKQLDFCCFNTVSLWMQQMRRCCELCWATVAYMEQVVEVWHQCAWNLCYCFRSFSKRRHSSSFCPPSLFQQPCLCYLLV